jgi:nitrite reductase/ring-hydroxylating ferredoxin subunit
VLVRLGERVHALQATCTHGDANLADAEVKGGEIECPFHGGRFDIATGAVTALPCTQPLPTFPVRIVDGTVEVAAPSLFDSKEGA